MPQTSDDKGHMRESDTAQSRRLFFSKATTIAIGTISLTILPCTLGGAEDEDNAKSSDKDQDLAGPSHEQPLFGFLVDTERCIGTGKCLMACRLENNVPEGFSRTWVERYVHFKDETIQVDTVPETGYAGTEMPVIDADNVKTSYFVPKLCNHCENPPCNQVCPTHASITSPEGVELIDPELCIGCAYCVQACPYGARFINPNTGNADKCTWCYHRLMRGQQPACVEACPTGARVLGRLDDPDSEISKRLAMIPVSVLKEHLGTHPKLRYTELPREVT